MKRQEAASSSYRAPAGRQTVAQGGTSGRSRSCRPGSAFQPIFSSPPESPALWAIRGERSGEGGRSLPSGESRVSLFPQRFSARSVIFANAQRRPPHPSPLPQHKKRVGGEGTIVGMLTQGAASGSCRRRRPGLLSDAPLGLDKEAAASCRLHKMSNLQILAPSYYLQR